MAMKKYYWLVYSYNNAGGGKTFSETATDNHPFEYMKEVRGEKGRLIIYNITLLNWKEITKSEFNMFQKMGG
jgi:hypothetical protein